jgi:acyl carrier protein
VETSGTVPIGRPVANTSFYVLDQGQRPVPIGVVGELYIGGEGVARGYFHQPELTAQRFLRNPFVNGSAGNRMYRTGDLVRHRADGVLEYVGRMDDQVKLRGHRIELGEIEASLRRHPAVREAAVVLHGDAGTGRLVAYYVLAPGARVTEADLESFLARELPLVMVPSVFLPLATLPMTTAGKLDRRALPAPGLRDRGASTRHVKPATRVEQLIATIWSEVLGVTPVGAEDDFFALGGNSLSTIQIAFRLRESLKVELPLRAIFEFPTVRGLATVLEKMLVGGAEDETLAALLAEVEALSDEEARMLTDRELSRPAAPDRENV